MEHVELENCPICQCDIEIGDREFVHKPKEGGQHSLHLTCLQEYWGHIREMSCPVCRREIRAEELPPPTPGQIQRVSSPNTSSAPYIQDVDVSNNCLICHQDVSHFDSLFGGTWTHPQGTTREAPSSHRRCIRDLAVRNLLERPDRNYFQCPHSHQRITFREVFSPNRNWFQFPRDFFCEVGNFVIMRPPVDLEAHLTAISAINTVLYSRAVDVLADNIPLNSDTKWNLQALGIPVYIFICYYSLIAISEVIRKNSPNLLGQDPQSLLEYPELRDAQTRKKILYWERSQCGLMYFSCFLCVLFENGLKDLCSIARYEYSFDMSNVKIFDKTDDSYLLKLLFPWGGILIAAFVVRCVTYFSHLYHRNFDRNGN